MTSLPRYDLRPDRPFSPRPCYWNGAHAILDEAEASCGPRRLALLDRMSRVWLQRSQSTLLAEIDALARQSGRTGVHFLNLSYEWSCTVAIVADADGAPRMLRVFDWGPISLGRTLSIITRPRGDGGNYLALSWPLFVGEATVIVPGRFAIALNRAPPQPGWTSRLLPPRLGQLAAVAGVAGRRAMPPAHLLRRVAEQASSADAAMAMLTDTPICRPAIFCVLGTRMEECGVLEKGIGASRLRAAPTVAANHWATLAGEASGDPESVIRSRTLAGADHRVDALGWCRPPVRNAATRFASEISVARQSLRVAEVEDLAFRAPPVDIDLSQASLPSHRAPKTRDRLVE